MSEVAKFLRTCVKTGAAVGIVTIATIGAFAYITKPDNRSLETMLGNTMTGQDENRIPVIGSMIADGAVAAVTTIDFKDFVIFKVATVNGVVGRPRHYFGLCQNWLPAD